MQGKYEQATSYIKNRVGELEFHSWFSNMKIEIQDSTLQFTTKSDFMKGWIEDNYSQTLEEVCKLLGLEQYTISVSSVSVNTVPIKAHGQIISKSMLLSENMIFDTFVVGQANRVAFEAMKRVSQESDVFNPLFIHGESGCGKTHLLQSAAWHSYYAGKRVCYISAEQYMISYINSLQSRDMMEFKNTFRNVDILIVDDFQFMGGKDSTQQEFFHTFVDLISKGKQIIISADKSPLELTNIKQRLRSRLGGGLQVQIYPASYELRLSILQDKIKRTKKQINSEILSLIATKASTSIRELEGILLRLYAQIDFFGESITIETAQDILDDMYKSEHPVNTEDIINGVTKFYGISRIDVFSASRIRKVVLARQMIMLLCRELLKKSLPDIAKIFGNRDHTKALYSINRIKAKAVESNEISDQIRHIKNSLRLK